MKTWILTLTLMLAASSVASAAEETVVCDVQTLADAQACMQKLAATLQDYEEPNDGFASTEKAGLLALFKEWRLGQADVRMIQDADFVGGMLVHMDEHHLVDYAIKRGRGVSPVEVYDFNTVDLEYMITGHMRDNPASADVGNYFLGLDGRGYDVYTDLKDTIRYLLDFKN